MAPFLSTPVKGAFSAQVSDAASYAYVSFTRKGLPPALLARPVVTYATLFIKKLAADEVCGPLKAAFANHSSDLVELSSLFLQEEKVVTVNTKANKTSSQFFLFINY
ncbi:hypothetical protein D3C73_1193510 [compost metagenome]